MSLATTSPWLVEAAVVARVLSHIRMPQIIQEQVRKLWDECEPNILIRAGDPILFLSYETPSYWRKGVHFMKAGVNSGNQHVASKAQPIIILRVLTAL
jgi:hypothetical protein